MVGSGCGWFGLVTYLVGFDLVYCGFGCCADCRIGVFCCCVCVAGFGGVRLVGFWWCYLFGVLTAGSLVVIVCGYCVSCGFGFICGFVVMLIWVCLWLRVVFICCLV